MTARSGRSRSTARRCTCVTNYYNKPEPVAGQEFVIAPADVTIYMGGDGYEGAVTDDGDGLAATNGFPVPGFVITEPSGVTSFDATKATLRYVDADEGINRAWTIVSYDGKTGHSIYRFEPTDGSDTAVRMQFITKDGSTVTEDEFTITDHLDQDLTMDVYGEGVDAGNVTMEYAGQTYTVSTDTGTLKVRSTTSEVEYGEVVSDASSITNGNSGVVAPADTVYSINGSAVQVADPSGVALLFDNIVENNDIDGTSNTDLLKERTDEELAKLTSTNLIGGTRHYECKYLDLVDTNNGNVWVAASKDITVYWPLPAGTSSSTKFELLHFEGLHREMGVDDVADNIDGCKVTRETITNTGTHISFTVDEGGFSPFVLVWETKGGGTPSTPSYVRHYVSNGGTEYPDETYPSGTVVDLTKVPIREGYTFTGWYADPELTEKITTVTMTSDKWVYAGWKYTDVPDWLNGDDHFAYIIGYPDGTVQPTGNITRAEVVAVFFRLLKEEVRQEYLTDQNDFNDVLLGRWYNINVSTMASLGIVAGRPDGDFDPNAPITRAELAAICARFDTSEIEDISQFTDIEGHWAEEEIQRAAALGWILGYPDGTFRPNQYITRAEAMTTINRVLQRLPENADDLLDGMNVWPDNQPGVWYYLAVQEATNTHDFVRKENLYEHWTQMREDPNWVQHQ